MSSLGPRMLIDRRLLGGAFGLPEAARRMSNFRWAKNGNDGRAPCQSSN